MAVEEKKIVTDVDIMNLMQNEDCEFRDEDIDTIVEWFRKQNREKLENDAKPKRTRATKKKVKDADNSKTD